MFRKMRRFKQQISDEKCVEILTNEPRGVLALYGENGYPYALPLDHLYDDGKLRDCFRQNFLCHGHG